MPKTRRSRGGFTLVEILCVVLILGIAAAMIAPQIGTQGDVRAAAASRVLMADLMYAQNRAITTQAYHYLIYSPATQSYTLYYLSSGALTPVQQPVTLQNYTTTLNTGELSDCSISGFNIGACNGIVFDELGSPHAYDTTVTSPTSLGVGAALSTAGTIEIQSGSQTVTVTVEPYTGDLKAQ
jgi:prepilin-type N-terminal cleavage/methylation domain-containing protein